MTKDPVCGMEVDGKGAELKANYKGEIYYFCCSACQKQFTTNPEKFVNGRLCK